MQFGCGAAAPNLYDGSYWALAPFYCDLWTQNASQVVANNIKYITTGVAPNRVFTVEFIDMAEWVAATSDYNFQVKLYETSGVIEFVYGTMSSSLGSVGVNYLCGINQQITASPPNPSEALIQQAPNSASFSNIPAYSNTVPTPNSKVTFTPPCTAPPLGTLSFTAITNTSMTLNWPDWATNELGYVIYYSIDAGITYNYLTITAANTTSYNATNLFYQGVYYWKVFAVTEGCLSNPLFSTQATLPTGNFISVKSGNWSDPTVWNAGTVPTNGDNVTIANTHTVTIDGDYGASNLIIGQGASGVLLIGNDVTNRTLIFFGNITVNTGAIFKPNPAFAATHTVNVYGNIINSGTFNMIPNGFMISGIPVSTAYTVPKAVADFTFNLSIGNQTISGAGATTTFNNITPNLGVSISNILEVTSTNFSVPSDFLKLTNANGTFKFSVPVNAITLDAFSTSIIIPPTSAIWMNSPNSTLFCHSTLLFRGNFTCSAGIVNVGDVADESLISNGAIFTIAGGTVNVAGRLTRPSYVAVTNFVMTGGTLNLNTNAVPSNDASPASGTTTAPPFCIDVGGSSFNMSGGTIVIPKAGSGADAILGGQVNLGYRNINCSNYSFTGGTLQIGDATTLAGEVIKIETDRPIYNLIVNSKNNPVASILTNTLSIKNNVTINSGSTLLCNNLNVNVGGTFLNNGSYIPGTNLTTFNGATAQSLSGTTTTGFYSLGINSAGVTLASPTTVSNALILTAGLVNTSAVNILTMRNASTAPALTAASTSYINGPMIYQKSSSGATTLNLPIGKGADCRPAVLTVDHTTGNLYNYKAELFNANPWLTFSSVFPADMPTTTVDTISGVHYWTITRTDATATSQPTLELNGNQQIQLNFGLNDQVFQGSSLTIVKNTASNTHNWLDIGGTSGLGNFGSAQIGNITSTSAPTAFNSFSSFTLGSRKTGWNPLPIDLLDFTALANGNKVDLKWETVTETNNSYFTIEKSKNGIDFIKLTDVQGAGNSTSQRDYYDSDYHPYTGISYYRLKQTDFNGNYKYYPIKSVTFNSKQNIQFYPNPLQASQSLTLQVDGFLNQEVLVVLRDITGRELYSKVLIISDNSFLQAIDSTNSLPTGLYIIVASSNGNIYNQKILVK